MQKKIHMLFFLCLLMLFSFLSVALASEYRLGAEDELTVTVWGYEDLKTDVTVRPDGMISFALVGDLKAEGLTVAQLTKEINKKLSLYIRNPHAFVVVKEFKGKKVYVLGEVTKPGMYKLTDTDNLAEAVANAGGLTSKGYWTKVGIVRNTAQGQEIVYADLGRVLKKGDLTQNLPLKAGDIVFVPKKKNWDIGEIAQALSTVSSVVYLTK